MYPIYPDLIITRLIRSVASCVLQSCWLYRWLRKWGTARRRRSCRRRTCRRSAPTSEGRQESSHESEDSAATQGDKERQGEARREKARQGETRRDTERRGETRRGNGRMRLGIEPHRVGSADPPRNPGPISRHKGLICFTRKFSYI